MKKLCWAIGSIAIAIPLVASADVIAPTPFDVSYRTDPATFIGSILIPFIITVLVEWLVFWLIIRQRPLILLLYSGIINLITLPIGNYIFTRFLLPAWLIEIGIFIVEVPLVMWLLKVKFQRAVLISLIANLVSTIAGYVWLWLEMQGYLY